MGVAVDDHVACSCGLPCCASAMASPMAEMRMGSLLKEMPSGDTQSLTAADDRGGRAEIAAFAGTLLAEHGERRRRAVMHDLDLRHLVGGRQQVIHEALGHQLAFVVIDELLQQRGAEAVGDAAERHALDDMRVDHRAAVMADHVAPDLGLAERGIDRHQHHVKLEGVARIHLHPAVLRQGAAGRHLHHMRALEAGLHALGQQMNIAMGDGDEFDPARAACRRRRRRHWRRRPCRRQRRTDARRSASASSSASARHGTPRRRA